MPIPYGHTRGSAAEQIAWLKDAIEAIEDGLGAAAVTIQYNHASALADHGRCSGLSDAGSGPGDDGDLAFKQH